MSDLTTQSRVAKLRDGCPDLPPESIIRYAQSMEEDYWNHFASDEWPRHLRIANELRERNVSIVVKLRAFGSDSFAFTAVGIDRRGVGAAVAVTLSTFGFNISGQRVFGFMSGLRSDNVPAVFVFHCELKWEEETKLALDIRLLEDWLNLRLRQNFELLPPSEKHSRQLYAEAVAKIVMETAVGAVTFLSQAATTDKTAEQKKLGPDLTDRKLGDDFVLVKSLAPATRMSVVWLAQQLSLGGRQVAMKILPFSFFTEDEVGGFRLRFQREAQILGRLNHDRIVHVYGHGQDEDLCWLAMEYLPGGHLGKFITAGQRPPIRSLVRWLKDCLEALGYAHTAEEGRAEVLHRDIKPENLLLTRDERIKVADFGLARLMQEEGRLTKSGGVMGTPYFMSPEQTRGDSLDRRSDIYSLGATFYTIASGQLPFRPEGGAQKTESEELAVMELIRNGQRLPLKQANPALPKALVWIIERMMGRDPDDRYPNAKTALGEIEGYEELRAFPEPLLSALSANPREMTVPWTGQIPLTDERPPEKERDIKR